ncbi:MAG TPA: hypothetical protein VM260_14725 [Pirellula sp.]|nr:hypothetical protein [Pirellula sp.]
MSVPVHVRQYAIDDLMLAYKSNLSKLAINPDHKFEIKFQSKKHSERETIHIDCHAYDGC